MDKMQLIVKREFERVTEVPVIAVFFREDERIQVVTSLATFEMLIGSDDDEFVFRDSKEGFEVRFPFPPDWDEAIDENNFS